MRKWQGGGDNQPPVTYQFGNKVNYRCGLEHIIRTYADPSQCDHLLGLLKNKEPVERVNADYKAKQLPSIITEAIKEKPTLQAKYSVNVMAGNVGDLTWYDH